MESEASIQLSPEDRARLARGVAGLERDATRPGRKPPLTAAAIERVVNMTLNEKPPAGTHWSARKLTKAVGLSHSSQAAARMKPPLKPAPAALDITLSETCTVIVPLVRSRENTYDRSFVQDNPNSPRSPVQARPSQAKPIQIKWLGFAWFYSSES